MKPKPRGLDRVYAEQFCDASVVDAYGKRPRYPDSLTDVLLEHAGDPRPHILDLGCGTGELARRLAARAEAVTAIDCSERMVNRARTLTGADSPSINWIVGRAENAQFAGPFSCALAAESIHWFDWDELWPRLAGWVPSARLLLVERREERAPWARALASLIADYSTNRDFEPYDILDELTSRRCFSVEGQLVLGPHPSVQTIEDYITSIHSRNGFSRDRMSADAARQFDAGVERALAPFASGGNVVIHVGTWVAWGRALPLEQHQVSSTTSR